MSNTGPRQLKDQATDPHEWPQLLARIAGAVLPCAAGPEWFSDDARQQATAARLCGACHVQTACKAYAYASDQKTGVWGGTTPADRKRHRRQARTAA